jgi:adenine-specific DNA-methyltransferase
LGGFLRRELDFYIKNEVMHLDDIEHDTVPRVEQYLSKIKVIRKIAHKIIQFLEQLENFQKKLWLKKKFVVETNYCITLDRVPEDLYPEIAANDAQREEWVRLFAIHQIEKNLNGPGYSQPLTVEFLQSHKFLQLDTKFFDSQFVNTLINAVDNIDGSLDGLLVSSDNFQALQLLSRRYTNGVSSIYIDPPYNTGPTEILYKNDYRNSSWLSLMADRIAISLPFLDEGACYSIAIDDFEMAHLCELADQMFTNYDRNMVVVNHHPQGGMSNNISRTHEYMLMMTPLRKDILRGRQKSGEIEHRSFMLSGPGDNKSRTGRPNSFYALLIDEASNQIVGVEPPPQLGKEYPKEKTQEGYVRRYPISPSGEEKVWCRSYDSAVVGLPNGEIVLTDGGTVKLAVDTTGKRHSLMSNWTDSRYNAGPHGTGLVADIMGNREAFSYPKSLFTVTDSVEAMTHLHETPIILDFFGGSATTAHAVVELNREDGGRRKYILVEMGQYFDSVTKPRVQKIAYSSKWEAGKPCGRDGVSHFFKYIRLESYEDALNNLELKRTSQQASLLDQDDDLREQYILSYMLDVESRGSQSLLNIESFRNPDQYKLRVERNGETQLINVDLVETFNWLLGLTVKHINVIRGVRVVEGTNPDGDRSLVLWRNLDEINNDALDEWFKKQDYNTKDQEYDLIYVNGDNNLENLRRGDQTWKVRLIEEEFGRLMFDVQDV